MTCRRGPAGIVIAEVLDTEGNTFTLRQRWASSNGDAIHAAESEPFVASSSPQAA